jgi:hypothetical protein
MTKASVTFALIFAALCCSAGVARAQSLALVTHVEGSGLDAEALRAALATELALPVEQVAAAESAHLQIDGASLTALHVAFVRADGSSVDRTLDVSSMREQAVDALALLAANLIRDEAAELLATLRAQTDPTALELPPSAASAPASPAAAKLRPPALELPRGCDRHTLRHASFGVDVVPFVGTGGAYSKQQERSVSLGVLVGLVGAVRGIQLAPLVNVTTEASCGIQLSGIANISAGPTQGVQLSEINLTQARLDGVQFGLVDIAGAQVTGAQFGMVNIDGGELHGVQFGLVDIAGADTRGLQVGLANASAGELHGAQLGLVNVAHHVQGGAQLGLVNVSAGEVKGAQIGLFNVSEAADAAIGLVSIARHGRTHLDVWGTDAGLGMIGIEHGAARVYNIYGVGATARDHRFVLSSALGLGVRLFESAHVFTNVDLVGYGLFTRDKAQQQIDTSTILQLRIPIGFPVLPGLAVFVAPALNLSIADAQNNVLVDPSLVGSARLTSRGSNVTARLWPGFSAGLRFF